MLSQNKRNRSSRIGICIALILGFTASTSTAGIAADSVSLGKSSTYAVLAAGGFTNSGSSSVQGDFGIATLISYVDTGSLSMNGSYHFGDANVKEALSDAKAVYASAQNQRATAPIATELAGVTKSPGVYTNPAGFNLNGTLTLDGQNNPNATFIFQTAGTLSSTTGGKVNIINAAQACNVYWQVGNSVNLESNTDLKGNILSNLGFKSASGTSIFGRVISIQGSVSLNGTTVVRAPCTKVSDDDGKAVIRTIASGSGEYVASGDNSHFSLNLKSRLEGGVLSYSGTASWYIIGKWKFEGKLNSYSSASGTGITSGSGELYYWGKDSKSKSPTKNGWITATTTAASVEVRFQTPTMNLKGTDRSTRVSGFAIGFTGAKVAEAPALPLIGALNTVTKIRG